MNHNAISEDNFNPNTSGSNIPGVSDFWSTTTLCNCSPKFLPPEHNSNFSIHQFSHSHLFIVQPSIGVTIVFKTGVSPDLKNYKKMFQSCFSGVSNCSWSSCREGCTRWRNNVRNSICNSFCNSIYNSVCNSICNSIHNSICDSLFGTAGYN